MSIKPPKIDYCPRPKINRYKKKLLFCILSLAFYEKTKMDYPLNITQEELDTLKQAFQLYDIDGDGYINIEQFASIITSLGLISNQLTSKQQQQDLNYIIQWADANKDNKIDFNEFALTMYQLMPHELTNDDDIKDCFRFFDLNHDGFISHKELEYVLNKKFKTNLTFDEIKDMMRLADINNDGYIDFDEFKKLLPPL